VDIFEDVDTEYSLGTFSAISTLSHLSKRTYYRGKEKRGYEKLHFHSFWANEE